MWLARARSVHTLRLSETPYRRNVGTTAVTRLSGMRDSTTGTKTKPWKNCHDIRWERGGGGAFVSEGATRNAATDGAGAGIGVRHFRAKNQRHMVAASSVLDRLLGG